MKTVQPPGVEKIKFNIHQDLFLFLFPDQMTSIYRSAVVILALRMYIAKSWLLGSPASRGAYLGYFTSESGAFAKLS